MKFYVGVTDNQWFDVVSHIPGIDEVNFWQPGGGSLFSGRYKLLQLEAARKKGKTLNKGKE